MADSTGDPVTTTSPGTPRHADRPARRSLSEHEMLRNLKAADSCSRPGELGLILRRVGLYYSYLISWRQCRTRRLTQHPQIQTPPREGDLTQTLLPLEHAHLTPGVRSSHAALESLLHESFTEIGATGRHYTRDTILPILLAPQPFPPRQISDFHARPITDTVALTTYTLTRTDNDGTQHHSRRSSLWLFEHTTWRLTFHQATNLPSPPSSPIS